MNRTSSAGAARKARGRGAAGINQGLTFPAARDPDYAVPFRAAVCGADLAGRRPTDAERHATMIVAAYLVARPMLRAGVTSDVEFVRAAGMELARVMEAWRE